MPFGAAVQDDDGGVRFRLWAPSVPRVDLKLNNGGPGRILPMPLFMEWAWTISFLATLVFPAVGIIADLRRHGSVHPAYWWGTGIYAVTFVASMLLAFSPLGYAVTEAVIAGTPGE